MTYALRIPDLLDGQSMINAWDWSFSQPLLGKFASLTAHGFSVEPNAFQEANLWWLVALQAGWLGLVSWLEWRRRQAIDQVRQLTETLARRDHEMAELREKLDQREEFIMHLNHELRNPLNQVIGESELATKGDIRGQAGLRPMLRALRRLAWRLECLNRFYELRDGQWVNMPETVDAEAWLYAQLNSLDTTELDVRVAFSARVQNPGHVRRAKFNTTDLRTALRHLVHNAIRFTREGQIEVIARIDAAQITIEVRDTGLGFDASRVQQGELAFYQADRSRTKHHQGLGVGLAICRALAERLGGRFEVKSEIDRGTVARFSLPIEVASVQPPLKQTTDDFALPHILVVDDDPANQEFLVQLCRSQGWAVDVAWNGQEAVRRSGLKYYDVILMDGAMPKMDGFEATRQIRQQQAQTNRQSTIVATTGLSSPADQQRFWEAGVDSFVTKPINPQEMVSLIRLHLGC